MTAQACRTCGCTDQFGCEERCHWVEFDLCSVCSGDTPRRRRHYTLTAAAVALLPHDDLALYNVPEGKFVICDPNGTWVGLASSIANAQARCRGLDADAIEHKRWRRGPIARRPRARLSDG